VNDSVLDWIGRAVRVQVKVGNQPALHVLTSQDLFPGGMAPAALPDPIAYSTPPVTFSNWPAAAVFKLHPHNPRAYYLMDQFGPVWAGGEAAPLFGVGPLGDARDMVLGPDGVSYYILQGNGNVVGCNTDGCSLTFNPPPPAVGQARSLALTPDGTGVYVVDGFGTVVRGGSAPDLGQPVGLPAATDKIRRIKLLPGGQGYYVMDIHGQVYRSLGAPNLAPGYSLHPGEDWARDFELTADGTGYYLLDQFGGIHPGGAVLPLTLNPPPTGGANFARDLELVDTRRGAGLTVSAHDIGVMVDDQTHSPVTTGVVLNNAGAQALDWSATSSAPPALSISPTNDTLNGGESQVVQLTLNDPASAGLGTHDYSVTVDGTSGSSAVEQVISVRLYVVDTVHRMYLPAMRR
jgi:hypothetical protein